MKQKAYFIVFDGSKKNATRKIVPPPPRKIVPHEIFCEFFLISNFYFYGNFRL